MNRPTMIYEDELLRLVGDEGAALFCLAKELLLPPPAAAARSPLLQPDEVKSPYLREGQGSLWLDRPKLSRT